jgi:hypothetical protein
MRIDSREVAKRADEILDVDRDIGHAHAAPPLTSDL